MKRTVFLVCLIGLLCSYGHAQENNINADLQVETATKQKVKVFPNPATNVVNILGLLNSQKADILISDVYGNVMLKHQWRIKNNALNIPIVNLTSGIYIVTIISNKQKVQTKFYKK
ncbi:MAG: T9SS type A sorting domain-containing protein [Maribacter sp.]|nr:T9SS type A sorting domain-containing protein [Maribacter sp.]